jgi:hypothetical protein
VYNIFVIDHLHLDAVLELETYYCLLTYDLGFDLDNLEKLKEDDEI